MKLTGNLKKQVEKAGTKDEKKSLIENAGMLLNDDELDQVSGGGDLYHMFYEDTGVNHMFGHNDESGVSDDNVGTSSDMSEQIEMMDFLFG